MAIHVADFVSKVSALRHDWEGFPGLSYNINLLDKGTEAGAEATTEHDYFVLLWAEACAVGEWKLELDLKELPRAILNMIPLNGVKPLLAVIPSEGVDVFFIDNSR